MQKKTCCVTGHNKSFSASVFPPFDIDGLAGSCHLERLDNLRQKKRTYEMLEACVDVVVIRQEYQPSVYSHRNRYMVEHSDRVIAVYDGREKGGTAGTIRFAHTLKKELREIPVGEIIVPDYLKR